MNTRIITFIPEVTSEESVLDQKITVSIDNTSSNISKAVFDIFSGEEKGYQDLASILKRGFRLFLNQNREVFPKYISSDGELSDKFFSKFETYYKRYAKALKGKIEDSLVEKGGENQLSSDDFDIIVKDVIGDLFSSIYMFGDSFDPDTFDSIFRNIENNFFDLQEVVSSNFEKFSTVLYNSDQDTLLDPNFEREPQILTVYKSLLGDGITDNGKICSNTLGDRIENHISIILYQVVYDIFDHWYRSTSLDLETIKNLEKYVRRLGQDVSQLEEQGIIKGSSNIFKIFSSMNIKEEKSFLKIIERIKCSEIEKELFILFFDGAINKSENNYDILYQAITQKREKYLLSYLKNYLSDEEIEGIDLNDVTFDQWYRIIPEKRREKFFDNLLVEDNGSVNIFSRYEQLIPKPGLPKADKTTQRLYGFLDEHFEAQKGALVGKDTKEKKKNYVIDSMKQLERIRKNLNSINFSDKDEKLRQYIEHNKNDIDLLVGFWWYNLREDYIQLNKQYQGEEGQKDFLEKYKPHGMMEAIVGELDNRNLLNMHEGNEIQIFPGKELKNSSSWNKTTLFERADHSYRHQLINLDDMKLGEKYLKDMYTLYLPSLECDSQEEILKFLDIGLDSCTALLERDYDNLDTNFMNRVREFGFNLGNLTEINELKEFLKYVKSCSSGIHSMVENSKQDREFFTMMQGFPGFEQFGEKGKDWKVGPPKKQGRIYQKSISKYSGDLREMGDLNRMLFVCNSENDMKNKVADFVEFLSPFSTINNGLGGKFIEQISIGDYAGNLTEKAKKPSGYRDVNLSIKLASGNTVEVQFHFKDFLEFKTTGYILGEDFLNAQQIKEKNIKKFTEKEAEEIQFLAQQDKEIKLPSNFGLLCKSGSFDFIDSMIKNSDNTFSSDVLYNLSRVVGNGSDLEKKLQRIESIGYEVSGGRTLVKEMK